jgi:hypothetical protein
MYKPIIADRILNTVKYHMFFLVARCRLYTPALYVCMYVKTECFNFILHEKLFLNKKKLNLSYAVRPVCPLEQPYNGFMMSKTMPEL